jgi:mono/diheme cytochrome c family protein
MNKKKLGAGIVSIIGLAIAISVLYLMLSGPRMRVQPKLVPLQAWLPRMPAGVVPVASEATGVPSIEEAAALRNPLPDTERTRRTGEVYYSYYCAFCHGGTGRGDGPVGDSYVPVPADLATMQVQTLSDGALYRAMLVGVGHEPVLPDVIRPEMRWYIVSYVRSLQRGRAEPSRPTSIQ